MTQTSRRAPIVLLASLAAAVSLAACGGSSQSASTSTAATTVANASATAGTHTEAARSHTATSHTASNRTASTATAQTKSAAAPHQPPTASDAAFEHALAGYAGCMRRNGVDIPPPRHGPNGPVLGKPKGVSTNSPRFVGALKHCRTEVRRVLTLASSRTRG